VAPGDRRGGFGSHTDQWLPCQIFEKEGSRHRSSKNWMTGRSQCWCHRCRRQWRARRASSRPNVCIRSMYRSPRHSRYSRSGKQVLASLFGRCSPPARQLQDSMSEAAQFPKPGPPPATKIGDHGVSRSRHPSMCSSSLGCTSRPRISCCYQRPTWRSTAREINA
jgi:hypothetical protein